MLFKDLVGKVCTRLESQLLREDEGIVAVEEQLRDLLDAVRNLGNKSNWKQITNLGHGGWEVWWWRKDEVTKGSEKN